MDRVGAGDLGGADDGRHVQVAVEAARRADADVLVGEPHVQRVLVGLGVHGDGLDAELAARADDPQGNLAAIRDQDLVEHQLGSLTFTRKQPLAELDRLAVLDVDRRDLAIASLSISFISFIASMMQSTWPFFTSSPTSTKGGAPGSGER